MSFFFKKKKPPTQEVNEDTTVNEAFTMNDNDDDLFDDMDLEVSSTPHEQVETTQQPIQQSNVDELKDLVLTDTRTDDAETKENVFAFIDEGESTVETVETLETTDEQITTDISQQQPTYDKIETDKTNNTTATLDESHPPFKTETDMVEDGPLPSSSLGKSTEVEKTAVNTITSSTKTTSSITPRQQIPKGKKKRKARLPGSEIRNTTEERHTQESVTSNVTDIVKDNDGNVEKETLTEKAKPEFCEGVIISSAHSHEAVEVEESKETENYKNNDSNGTVANKSKDKEEPSAGQESANESDRNSVETSLLNNNVETIQSIDHAAPNQSNDQLNKENADEEENLDNAQVELKEETEDIDDSLKTDENIEQDDNQDDLFDSDMLTEFDNKMGNSEPSQDVQIQEESPISGADIVDKRKELSLELNEDDQFYLAVESLEMKFNALREIIEGLSRKRDEVISNWNSSKVDIDSIPEKVKELQEKQQMFAEQDDFDQAAEIEQQTRDLILQGEHFKYQHPFLNERIFGVVVDFKESLTRHTEEKSTLMSAYQELLTTHEKRIKNEDKSADKLHDELELRLKEEKLTLDRKLSHLTLDKEHLNKNKDILDEEIKRKTSNLLTEKQVLLEKRSLTQEKIRELEEELKKYREEERTYDEKIEIMDRSINDITREFEPRLKKIELEQLENISEEENTKEKMAGVERQMDEVAEKKHLKEAKIKRDQSILNDLKSKTNQLETMKLSTNMADENFSLDAVTGPETFINADNAEIEEIKKKIVEAEVNYQKYFDKILYEKSRLKSLERMVKDLEGQLLELQKAKQVAVKERKYKDAKSLSEEIKTLTEEGEEKQKEILNIEQSLKHFDADLHSTKDELSNLQKDHDSKLKDFDYKIIKSLQQSNEDIKSFLIKNPDTWFKEICDLQLVTNQEIIQKLSEKHCFLEECGNKLLEKLSQKLLHLEQQLNKAENDEDWDLAEKLNDEITLIKTKIDGQS